MSEGGTFGGLMKRKVIAFVDCRFLMRYVCQESAGYVTYMYVCDGKIATGSEYGIAYAGVVKSFGPIV